MRVCSNISLKFPSFGMTRCRFQYAHVLSALAQFFSKLIVGKMIAKSDGAVISSIDGQIRRQSLAAVVSTFTKGNCPPVTIFNLPKTLPSSLKTLHSRAWAFFS